MPASGDLYADRGVPFDVTIPFEGVDFTGATFEMGVLAYPDAAANLITLANATAPSEGISVAVATEAGLTTSSVNIRILEATIESAVPFTRPRGGTQDLAYYLDVTTSALGKRRWLIGHFYVRPQGDTAGAPGSTIKVVYEDGVPFAVQVYGADLLAPILADTEEAAASAAASATAADASEADAEAAAAAALVSEETAGAYLDAIEDAVAGGLPATALTLQATSTTALTAMTGMSAGRQAYLGQDGVFDPVKWLTANHAADVTAYPGIFWGPDSDPTGASGAWKRLTRGPIDPVMLGATQNNARTFTRAFNQAAAYAAASGINEVVITAGTWLRDASLIVPAGVKVFICAGAIVKRRNEVRTTLTSAFTGGSGSKSFGVTDITSFEVGQEVMFYKPTPAAATTSPNDAFSHLNPVITAITPGAGVTGTITITPNSTILAHAIGDYIQTAARGFVLNEGASIELVGDIDGNYANQSVYSWLTHIEAVGQGSRNRIHGNGRIINTPSDAVLIASAASGSYIEGSSVEGITFSDIGGNAIHYGLTRHDRVEGIKVVGANKRNTGINTAHQDGAVIMSDNCRGLSVTDIYVEDALSGVGSIDGSAVIENDRVIIKGLRTHNVRRPLEVEAYGRDVLLDGFLCTADVSLVSGATQFGTRWDANQIAIIGSDATTRPQNIVIKNGIIRNGNIYAIHTLGLTIENVQVDNSGNMAPTQSTNQIGVSVNQSAAFAIRNVTCQGSTGAIGGTTSFAVGDTTNVPSSVSDCVLFNQKSYAISFSFSAPATSTQIDIDNCKITSRSGISDPGYIAVGLNTGMFATDNRLELGVGTAWTGSAPRSNRRNNRVNGLFEALPEFADDAAAAAATGSNAIAIGGEYRTGSVKKVRVA